MKCGFELCQIEIVNKHSERGLSYFNLTQSLLKLISFLFLNDHQVTIGQQEPFRTIHAYSSEHNVTKRFSKEVSQS
jgi:hypothetical protein